MVSLTRTQLSSIVEGDLSKIELIDLSDRRLNEIEDLSLCKSLKRIELKNNCLDNLECLQMNFELKWIDAQHNNLFGYVGNVLRNLSNLSVLNLSHNQIVNVDNLFDGLNELRSLIISNNHIVSVQGFAKLQNLEALIISGNRLESFSMPKRPMPALKKLSLGNNRLKTFNLDINVFNLRELRLNGNQLSDVPSNLYCCGQLEILDLGKNCLSVPAGMGAAEYCVQQFRRCKKLKALNLAGNVGLAKNGAEWDAICAEIRKAVPTLEIFNSKKFQGTVKPQKNKRALRHPENGKETGDENETKRRKKENKENCETPEKGKKLRCGSKEIDGSLHRNITTETHEKDRKPSDNKKRELREESNSCTLPEEESELQSTLTIPSLTVVDVKDKKVGGGKTIINLNSQDAFINKMNQISNHRQLLTSWDD